jgi:Cft2 family RNA processing exonuclease
MVCSEILTGNRPFQNREGLNYIHQAVQEGDMPVLPLDPADPLRRLIEDCWSFSPEA